MATVASFMEQFRRECGENPPDPILALAWLQGRYGESLERAPWQFLTKESVVTIAAPVTTGTVTVVNGSATVTETTSNANSWSSTLNGYFFRITGDNVIYEISSFTNANPDTLTLTSAYEGDSATEASYTAWQRYSSLASDVRSVVSVFGDNGQLQEVSQTDLDTSFSARSSSGDPEVWALAGRDSSNYIRIETYPVSDDAETIRYRYVQATPTLSGGGDTLLPFIPTALLRAGCLSDYWGWRSASSADSAGMTLKLAMSQRFEDEFQKRMQELLARECLALSPKRIRLQPRFVRHRLQGKFS